MGFEAMRQLCYRLQKKKRLRGVIFLCCLAIITWYFTYDSAYFILTEFMATKYETAIQHEIINLDNHNWAGDYYFGDGKGVNVTLSIAPDSGFVYQLHGCCGYYDRNYGPVKYKEGVIELSCKLKNERKGFHGIAEELVSVSWGDRQYLIPSDEIIDFCNDVNSKEEPRFDLHGPFHLLKIGDEHKDVSGLPDIPTEFLKYLLQNSIETEIIAIGESSTEDLSGEWERRYTTITLNKGYESGLLEGMELYIFEPRYLTDCRSAMVIEVEKHSSKARLHQMGYPIKTHPESGWKLSTERP